MSGPHGAQETLNARHLLSNSDPTRSQFDARNYVVLKLDGEQRVQGTILRLNDHEVICRVHSPDVVFHAGLELTDSHIVLGNRTAYCGQADVNHVLDTGVGTILEIGLGQGWFSSVDDSESMLSKRGRYLPDIQGTRRALRQIDYAFKIVVADILTLLQDLQERLELLEMELRHLVLDERATYELEIMSLIETEMLPELDEVFREFESVALWVPSDDVDLHLAYVQKHLHPFLVCSPFIHRVHEKPLGYPGDYRMLNQLLDDPYVGGSLFAKTLNAWIIGTSAGDAYRYRIDLLTETLTDELRERGGNPVEILNVGCGAARELQNLVNQGARHLKRARFSLMDFNAPTLEHCEEQLSELCERLNCELDARYLHLNVQQLLAEGRRRDGELELSLGSLDVIYCAGLFDYLSEDLCVRLISLFYDLLAPGGRIVLSNFSASNPIRHFMSYLLEWHLTYRSREELHGLVPTKIRSEAWITDDSSPDGVENYLHIRKPC